MFLKTFAIAGLAMASGASALTPSANVPACLANCLRNVTNPCDGSSLGGLFYCLNDQCLDAASTTSISLTPKAKYSCQQSFVPGTEDSPSLLTAPGDGSCVTNSFDFRSFIPSTGPASQVNYIEQDCKFELFPDPNCAGEAKTLDLSILAHGTCAFYGGRSMRFGCSEPEDPTFDPYHYLEQMCANSSTTTASASMAPNPYAPPPHVSTTYFSTPYLPSPYVSATYVSTPNVSSAVANSTVHRVSITTTISATETPYASNAADGAKPPMASNAAATESPMKPSVVALVGVLAAAILMI